MHKNNLQIFEELTLSEEACTVGGHSRRGVYHPRRDFRNLRHYSFDCATPQPDDSDLIARFIPGGAGVFD